MEQDFNKVLEGKGRTNGDVEKQYSANISKCSLENILNTVLKYRTLPFKKRDEVSVEKNLRINLPSDKNTTIYQQIITNEKSQDKSLDEFRARPSKFIARPKVPGRFPPRAPGLSSDDDDDDYGPDKGPHRIKVLNYSKIHPDQPKAEDLEGIRTQILNQITEKFNNLRSIVVTVSELEPIKDNLKSLTDIILRNNNVQTDNSFLRERLNEIQSQILNSNNPIINTINNLNNTNMINITKRLEATINTLISNYNQTTTEIQNTLNQNIQNNYAQLNTNIQTNIFNLNQFVNTFNQFSQQTHQAQEEQNLHIRTIINRLGNLEQISSSGGPPPPPDSGAERMDISSPLHFYDAPENPQDSDFPGGGGGPPPAPPGAGAALISNSPSDPFNPDNDIPGIRGRKFPPSRGPRSTISVDYTPLFGDLAQQINNNNNNINKLPEIIVSSLKKLFPDNQNTATRLVDETLTRPQSQPSNNFSPNAINDEIAKMQDNLKNYYDNRLNEMYKKINDDMKKILPNNTPPNIDYNNLANSLRDIFSKSTSNESRLSNIEERMKQFVKDEEFVREFAKKASENYDLLKSSLISEVKNVLDKKFVEYKPNIPQINVNELADKLTKATQSTKTQIIDEIKKELLPFKSYDSKIENFFKISNDKASKIPEIAEYLRSIQMDVALRNINDNVASFHRNLTEIIERNQGNNMRMLTELSQLNPVLGQSDHLINSLSRILVSTSQDSLNTISQNLLSLKSKQDQILMIADAVSSKLDQANMQLFNQVNNIEGDKKLLREIHADNEKIMDAINNSQSLSQLHSTIIGHYDDELEQQRNEQLRRDAEIAQMNDFNRILQELSNLQPVPEMPLKSGYTLNFPPTVIPQPLSEISIQPVPSNSPALNITPANITRQTIYETLSGDYDEIIKRDIPFEMHTRFSQYFNNNVLIPEYLITNSSDLLSNSSNASFVIDYNDLIARNLYYKIIAYFNDILTNPNIRPESFPEFFNQDFENNVQNYISGLRTNPTLFRYAYRTPLDALIRAFTFFRRALSNSILTAPSLQPTLERIERLTNDLVQTSTNVGEKPNIQVNSATSSLNPMPPTNGGVIQPQITNPQNLILQITQNKDSSSATIKSLSNINPVPEGTIDNQQGTTTELNNKEINDIPIYFENILQTIKNITNKPDDQISDDDLEELTRISQELPFSENLINVIQDFRNRLQSRGNQYPAQSTLNPLVDEENNVPQSSPQVTSVDDDDTVPESTPRVTSDDKLEQTTPNVLDNNFTKNRLRNEVQNFALSLKSYEGIENVNLQGLYTVNFKYQGENFTVNFKKGNKSLNYNKLPLIIKAKVDKVLKFKKSLNTKKRNTISQPSEYGVPTTSSSSNNQANNEDEKIEVDTPKDDDNNIDETGQGIKSFKDLKNHHEKLSKQLYDIHKQRMQHINDNLLKRHVYVSRQLEHSLKKMLKGKGISNSENNTNNFKSIKPLKCQICNQENDFDSQYHLTKGGEILHESCFKAKGMSSKRKRFQDEYGHNISEDSSYEPARKLAKQQRQAKLINLMQNKPIFKKRNIYDELDKNDKVGKILSRASRQLVAFNEPTRDKDMNKAYEILKLKQQFHHTSPYENLNIYMMEV